MNKHGVVTWIVLILIIIGGLNWGLVGFFNFDLVAFLFGDMTVISRIVYGLVGLSAVLAIIKLVMMPEKK